MADIDVPIVTRVRPPEDGNERDTLVWWKRPPGTADTSICFESIDGQTGE